CEVGVILEADRTRFSRVQRRYRESTDAAARQDAVKRGKRFAASLARKDFGHAHVLGSAARLTRRWAPAPLFHCPGPASLVVRRLSLEIIGRRRHRGERRQ